MYVMPIASEPIHATREKKNNELTARNINMTDSLNTETSLFHACIAANKVKLPGINIGSRETEPHKLRR